VRRYTQLVDIAVATVEQFLASIQSGEFPGVVTDTFLAGEATKQ